MSIVVAQFIARRVPPDKSGNYIFTKSQASLTTKLQHESFMSIVVAQFIARRWLYRKTA
jgi:hypothetical protein